MVGEGGQFMVGGVSVIFNPLEDLMEFMDCYYKI